MRVVVQRSGPASVTVDGEMIAEISRGFVLFVGIQTADSIKDVLYLADKIVHLRIFEDTSGKMTKSILDCGGEILSISQFTLYGDVRKGRRPNYMSAAPTEIAKPLYEALNVALQAFHVPVKTGVFGAMMQVQLVNDGPVTILLDSDKVF